MIRMHFDEVSYSSKVEHLKRDMFRINYTDSLRKGDIEHQHHFYEIVKVEGDKIIDIQNYTSPEESQALMNFFRKVQAAT